MRYFIDENLLGIAKLLVQVRDDVVYPSHPDIPEIPLRTPDLEWLPLVGEREWVVIMRDKKIRTRRAERQAILDNRVRAFCLTSSGNARSWDLLTLIVRHWDAIAEKGQQEGPYIYSVTRVGVSHSPIA